jgi:hypothetical protein
LVELILHAAPAGLAGWLSTHRRGLEVALGLLLVGALAALGLFLPVLF